ncbi:MAG: ATP-binding cassette domain-containing protein [Crocinitomicaceae bacterium]|nr:ATP-binding cassette domain-containing protein [Crocinitomicaceae bacterium]
MIHIDQLSKSFNRKPALSDVSLTIPSGQIYGLLGPNGAGKTTLIRIMNQILKADQGIIQVDGKLLSANHWKDFGYLPEERGLYKSMNVNDTLVFLARLRGLTKYDAQASVRFWLEKFEISSWAKTKIEALSKGMAQKVQFIAAVVHQPNYLILDEPLSGFDPINVELILSELKSMRADGKTIILSTHNMKSVEEICDHVALLHKSKLIAEGKVHALREKALNGEFIVRFSGNMIALANALWTEFELIDTKEIGENRFQIVVRQRGERTFEELASNLMGKLKLEAIEKRLPSMQEVFLELIAKEEVKNEE